MNIASENHCLAPCGAAIPLEKLPNTRDLGGYRTKDGRMILPRRLIRSGALANAGPRDIQTLTRDYHLRRIVDFRTDVEREQRPDPNIPGVLNIHNAILNEAQTGITRETFGKDPRPYGSLINHAAELLDQAPRYMESLYSDLAASPDAAAHYGAFLEILLDAEEDATLWHCSAGKDRVGFGTALLLSALGIPRDVIISDFVRTNEYLAPETARMKEEARKQTDDPRILANLELLNSVRDTYLLSAFSSIEHRFGTVENYLEEMTGFGPEKCRQLQRMYLTDSQ